MQHGLMIMFTMRAHTDVSGAHTQPPSAGLSLPYFRHAATAAFVTVASTPRAPLVGVEGSQASARMHSLWPHLRALLFTPHR